MIDAPKRLTGYEWVPATYAHQSRLFRRPPDVLVVHSGAFQPDVASYLANIRDGRYVSAHFAWDVQRCANAVMVQQVPLIRQAWHAGGSTFMGRKAVNARSIGIELPGPWGEDPRSNEQRLQLRELVRRLCEVFPSLRYVVRHSDIKASKRDPGPGFAWEWLEGLGLEMPFR